MIDLVYIVFGIICALGLISNNIQDESFKKLLVAIAGTVLIALSGFREIGVDQDSVGYLKYYNLDDVRMALAAEPTFVYIAKFTRSIFHEDGIRALFLIYAFAGVTLKIFAIRRIGSFFWLSTITYFSSYYIIHEMTQIRAGVACALVLLSIQYIYNRNLVKFISIISIASIFHYSSLAALPLYFLSRSLSFPVKIAIASAIPLGILLRSFDLSIIYSLPINIVEDKIDTYNHLQDKSDVFLNIYNAVYLVKYAILYIFLFFGNRIDNKYYPVILQMYAISMFSYIALSYNSFFAMRISELYGVVEIVLYPMLLYAVRSRVLGVLAIVTLALGNLLIGIYQSELIHQTGWEGL